jgi:hypothetical protein
MSTSDGLMIGAGAVAFIGSFSEAGGWPDNGYAIIGGTTALAFLSATTNNGPLAGPVKALAGLMLLVAIYRYVPTFATPKAKKKGKNNG